MGGGFYRIDYVGRADSGSGAIAIVNGQIAGLDITGGEYRGSYQEVGGRIRGDVTLTAKAPAALVTGRMLRGGETVPIALDIPAESLDGAEFPISVAGGTVRLRLTKIAEL